MKNKAAFWIQIGAISGLLAVTLGALAAHGLEEPLKKYAGITKKVVGEEVPGPLKYLGDFKTAAEYQMYHSLALIAVGLLSLKAPGKALNVAGWSFLVGILLFSGSLYFLVLSGVLFLGAITPLGGIAFLVGWGSLFVAARGVSKAEGP